jgi:Tfp pilus assembly protein PilV
MSVVQGLEPRRVPRGVSLVEALVALAIMAFGMVGVVGIQAGLRANADVAKVRSEAVRIAQERIESRRGYSLVQAPAVPPVPPAPVPQTFAAIATQPDADVTGTTVSFTVRETVAPQPALPAGAQLPRSRTLVLDVSWEDRSQSPADGAPALRQRVVLPTLVAGVPPELAGALSLPTAGSPLQNPRGRHGAIPPEAVAGIGSEAGISRFTPPGAPTGTTWVFDNVTGFITQTCIADVCTVAPSRLLAGFVRFATGGAPTTSTAENPPGTLQPGVGVAVTLTAPAASTLACFTRIDTAAQAVEYFCAVPVTAPGVPLVGTPSWSGRSNVTGLTWASTIADPAADKFRVCRYTTVRGHTPVPPMRNEDHPRDYAAVTGSLINQNFLVLRAGDGADVYGCPEGSGVAGRTWHHQPDV